MTLNPLVLVDCRLYLAGADLTGYSNKVELAAKPAVLEATTFSSVAGQAYRSRAGGVFEGSAALEGLWQAGDLGQPDDAFWASLGVSTVPLTGVPTGGAVGDLAYLTRGLLSQYSWGGKHGELLPWSGQLATGWPIARGQILHPQGTARTATGNGTARQIGALTSAQAMYVCLHVLSVAGTTPSLTVALQSDDNAGMTSPSAQGTFTAATALGGQSMRVVGPVTDDWWRITYTISGTTPSFLFAVSAGIAAK